MSRAMMILVVGLLVAVPVSACVPEASNETPSGADVTQSSKITEAIATSGGDVSGRPTQVPAGMGGTINLDNGGQAGNSTAGGQQGSKDPLDASGGATGQAPDGSTVADGPNGTKIVTIPPGKDGKVRGGVVTNGREAREGATTTVKDGGKITATTATANPAGGFDLDGVTRIEPGAGTDSTINVTGGNPVVPGATVGVTVDDAGELKDANQAYGE